MKTQKKYTFHLKRAAVALLMMTLPFVTWASETTDPMKRDTVIIEINKNSKIVIVTKDRKDLAALENYDINQMIKDLNNQLTDSVEYMEIQDGKAYVNEDEVDMNTWKKDSNDVRIKLGGVEVEVDPDEVEDWDDDDWNDRKKEKYEIERVDRTTHHFNVDIGLNNWVEDGEFPNANNAPYAVKSFGSWYLGLNSTNRTWVTGPIFLEWGLGINWYNWKLEDPDFFIQEGDTQVEFNLLPTELNGQKSKLTASYINATVVPMFDFSRGRQKITSIESGGLKIKKYSRKGLRFGVGGYVGYRLGSHSKIVYKNGGDREKDKERDDFFLENLRYGLRGQIGWKGVELFVAYDLNEVFSTGRGPTNLDTQQNARLNAVSFGITL